MVLDESSILKQSDGKTRTMLIRHFADVPYRLACTATPAPNDPEELTSQAEFLGHSTRVNMLAAYFVHDQDGWRLKGHAHRPMMKWMATWAMAIRRPSDMGADDAGYDLPGLTVTSHLIDVEIEAEGQLFATELGGVGGRARVRRSTLTNRVERAVQLVHDCETPTTGLTRVHGRVLPGEQAKVATDAGAEGTAKTEAPPALRGRQGIPRQGEPSGGGIPEAPPLAAQSVAVRLNGGSSGVDDRPRVPDLSGQPSRRPKGEDAHRSRPRNGHGPGCSLSEMQSGAGAFGRRPDTNHGDVPLRNACRDQWVIWCGLNDEQDALVKALGSDCRSIDGRTKPDDRVEFNEAWVRGEFRVLIVKPGMYSYGMNWQHCARMAFVGLSDSYEQYYQAIRRCYRYGQTRVVDAHVILSSLEGQIATNVARKERESGQLTEELVSVMRANRVRLQA